MVCPACGCEQLDGVAFCKACGGRLAGFPSAGAGEAFGQQPWMPLTGNQPPGTQPPPSYGYGSPSAAPMLQPRRDRVRQNLQPMGITWCLWGVYRLLIGTLAGFAMHTVARHHMWFGEGSDFVPGFLGSFVPFIAVSTVVMSALALLTGWALLTLKPWGRTLAIIMAILTLIRIPLGTALGIYTLWVLAPRISGLEYDAMAASTPQQV